MNHTCHGTGLVPPLLLEAPKRAVKLYVRRSQSPSPLPNLNHLLNLNSQSGTVLILTSSNKRILRLLVPDLQEII